MVNTNVENYKKDKSTTSKVYQMTIMGLMTAVICIIAPISIVFPFSPVPVSLGTLAIYIAVIVLGKKEGLLSVLLYIFLGFIGLPVFSGFTGGAGKLLGPTGGYIIGYIFMALICGLFIEKKSSQIFYCLIGMFLGTTVCYFFGTIWLSIQSEISLSAAFMVAVLPFLPADFIKLLLACSFGFQIRKRLKKAGLLFY